MFRPFSISSFLLLFGLICHSNFLLTSASKVDSSLLRTFEKTNPRSTAKIMVEMAGVGTSKVLESIKGRRFRTKSERASFTVNRLKAQTGVDQRNILDFLNQRNERSRSMGEPEVHVTTFWITNKISISNADLNLIKELEKREDVVNIRENIVVPLLEPMDFELKETKDFSRATPTWSVSQMNGDQAWANGVDGSGVRVAVIDTGVRGTHEALAPSYCGLWQDPIFGTAVPTDDHGHGTHVCGLITGQNGIGMAPGAEWMGCVGCSWKDGCFEEALISCAEFAACPTPNCEGSADIASNSWGGPDGGVLWYHDCINTWTSLGILALFACGNSGPYCSELSYPASHPDVIAVAACDKDDKLAYFSSRGPARGCPEVIKPDCTGYGMSVTSSWLTADNAYASLSGTSMSCPLVAGLCALYLSDPDAKINSLDSFEQILIGNTKPCQYTNESCFGQTHNAPGKNWWEGVGVVRYVSPKPVPE